MVIEESAISKVTAIVALFAAVVLFPVTTQAAEVGTQIYWALEPAFGVLFLSVRIWPFEGLAVSGGMGECEGRR
jgi:nitrate reductase NapE component